MAVRKQVPLLGVDRRCCGGAGASEARVRRRNTAPPDRAGIRRKQLGIIEMLLADAAPSGIFNDASVEFVLPQDRHRLALCVVIDTGGMHKGRLAQPRSQFNAFDEPTTLPKMNELPALRQLRRCYQRLRSEKLVRQRMADEPSRQQQCPQASRGVLSNDTIVRDGRRRQHRPQVVCKRNDRI